MKEHDKLLHNNKTWFGRNKLVYICFMFDFDLHLFHKDISYIVKKKVSLYSLINKFWMTKSERTCHYNFRY